MTVTPFPGKRPAPAGPPGTPQNPSPSPGGIAAGIDPNLQRWCVTFATEYGFNRLHPHQVWAVGDGWLDVWAIDYDMARELTISLLGIAWSSLEEGDTFDPKWFPGGCLAVIAPAAGFVESEEGQCPWWIPVCPLRPSGWRGPVVYAAIPCHLPVGHTDTDNNADCMAASIFRRMPSL